ncbi:MAG: glutamine amidotransferase family protein [Blastochloris sp.]|nr:glutamine amidotransferase family protein [Blastochloris sp.]
MCGIAAFFSKNSTYESRLGELFVPMLDCLTGRGPDSAGFAVYRDPAPAGSTKIVAQHPSLHYDWKSYFDKVGRVNSVKILSTHALAYVSGESEILRAAAEAADPAVTVMSVGSTIEIYKEMGLPCKVMAQFNLSTAQGSHAIGHTRMATESAVTTAGSHPFSTGMDLCLVHNGSLSNHNRLRRNLERQGIRFRTDNDSEVAAGYLAWRLRQGDSLESSLKGALRDLDGFFTFAIGTKDGFAVLRDPIACKPAILAETDDYVAMASEYRSLAHLPNIDKARIWEPEPARIYTWNKADSSLNLKAA